MDIMKAILDIENKAQEIEASTKHLLAEIKGETDRKIEGISKKAQEDAETEIEKFRETVKSGENDELSRAKVQMDKTLHLLEMKFEENRDNWIKEITDEIIKGDDE